MCIRDRVYYGNYEFDKECITNRDRMFDCPQNLREEELFEVPQWAANKVVYQIFPSRFAATQPVDKELWYKAPITPMDDLHGNLRGIIEHLDYDEIMVKEPLHNWLVVCPSNSPENTHAGSNP